MSSDKKLSEELRERIAQKWDITKYEVGLWADRVAALEAQRDNLGQKLKKTLMERDRSRSSLAAAYLNPTREAHVEIDNLTAERDKLAAQLEHTERHRLQAYDMLRKQAECDAENERLSVAVKSMHAWLGQQLQTKIDPQMRRDHSMLGSFLAQAISRPKARATMPGAVPICFGKAVDARGPARATQEASANLRTTFERCEKHQRILCIECDDE